MKPKPERICVVFNPAARGEKASRLRERIHTLSPGAIVRETTAPGDGERLAATAVAEGFETVVAAGGDGTIHAVVNGIAGHEARLGILPLGTMNLFAAELGIPSRIEEAWRVIESGHVRTIDLPFAGDRFFVQIAGIGLDAQVVKETDPGLRRTFGPLSYVLALAQIATRQPPRIRIRTDDGRAYEGAFALLGNGRFYGAPLPIFRDALPDDGLLDLLVFRETSHLDLLRYLQGLVFGTHLDMPDIEYVQCTGASASDDGAEEIPVEADGELVGVLPTRFGIAEHKLEVLTPPANRGSK